MAGIPNPILTDADAAEAAYQVLHDASNDKVDRDAAGRLLIYWRSKTPHPSSVTLVYPRPQ